MQKRAYSHVIWDWNGTLLDDIDWCIACMNAMLEKRGKPLLKSRQEYHGVFGFPIMEYYQKVGFDLSEEPFEALAKEYIGLYHGEGAEDAMPLHGQAEFVLRTLQNKGLSQIILSASAKDNLLAQVAPFHIGAYFDEVLGISDIYAKSKVALGLDYLARNHIDGGLLVGDTTHDYEVAQAMGMDCILIAQGHEAKEKLLACRVPVLGHLPEILDYIV